MPAQVFEPDSELSGTRIRGDFMDYDDACKAAATNQGLDPIMARLKREKIVFSLEQTGGFTMVVYVEHNNGLFFGISKDNNHIVCLYDARQEWIEGADAYVPTLDRVVEIIKGSTGLTARETVNMFFDLPERV